MTPTPTILLLVALLWTLPATVVALTYRRFDSIENVTASLKQSLGGSRALTPPLKAEVEA